MSTQKHNMNKQKTIQILIFYYSFQIFLFFSSLFLICNNSLSNIETFNYIYQVIQYLQENNRHARFKQIEHFPRSGEQHVTMSVSAIGQRSSKVNAPRNISLYCVFVTDNVNSVVVRACSRATYASTIHRSMSFEMHLWLIHLEKTDTYFISVFYWIVLIL